MKFCYRRSFLIYKILHKFEDILHLPSLRCNEFFYNLSALFSQIQAVNNRLCCQIFSSSEINGQSCLKIFNLDIMDSTVQYFPAFLY